MNDKTLDYYNQNATIFANSTINVVSQLAFVNQMKDVIDYRTVDYYQRRYRSNKI
jgi:hypothetical protein